MMSRLRVYASKGVSYIAICESLLHNIAKLRVVMMSTPDSAPKAIARSK